MRHPQQVAAEFAADKQPYAVFIDNNLGSRRDYLHQLCAALRPLNKIWSAAVTIDVTDDPGLIRNMALLDAQEYSLVSNHSPIIIWLMHTRRRPKLPTMPAGCAFCMIMEFR